MQILVHGRGESAHQIGPILAARGGALDDLVIYVGDVAYIGDRVAQRSQVALYEIEHRQHACVADMDVVVIGHSTHVHAHFIEAQRFEFFFLAGE